MRSILAAAAASLALIGTGAAHADIVHYETTLGPEVLGATGSGTAEFTYDNVAHTLSISTVFSGLSGLTTVSHIHCCTAVPGAGTVAVAVTPGTLPGFPTNVSAGNYSILLDLTLATTYTTGFINNFAGGQLANAEGALIAGINAGRAYLNIHTNAFPGGEIRGFLDVPEPASIALALAALGALPLARRRARAGASASPV